MTVVSVPVHTGPATSVRSLLSSWKAVIGYGLTGLVSLIAFGFGTDSGVSTSFSVSRAGDALQVPTFSVPAQPVTITLSVTLRTTDRSWLMKR